MVQKVIVAIAMFAHFGVFKLHLIEQNPLLIFVCVPQQINDDRMLIFFRFTLQRVVRKVHQR